MNYLSRIHREEVSHTLSLGSYCAAHTMASALLGVEGALSPVQEPWSLPTWATPG